MLHSLQGGGGIYKAQLPPKAHPRQSPALSLLHAQPPDLNVLSCEMDDHTSSG